MCKNELKSPNTFKSHKTTTIATTAFRMDLIVPCIGMYRLISQSNTPTTIKTITIFINGMTRDLLAQQPFLVRFMRIVEAEAAAAPYMRGSMPRGKMRYLAKKSPWPARLPRIRNRRS